MSDDYSSGGNHSNGGNDSNGYRWNNDYDSDDRNRSGSGNHSNGGHSECGNGSNHPAVIGTPTVSSVTEDASAPNLTATGTISITDADRGQSSFQTSVISAHGNLGTLSLRSDGSYTYTVANSAVQYLGANDSKVDSFTIASADGTTKVVNFTIHGANDAAVIGTPTVSSVTEDSHITGGYLVASGKISISDVDQNQSSFQTSVNPAQGNLGTLSLQSNGSYTYTVANSAVQYLGANDSKTESFTITAADGTTKVVSFIIHGANDAAVIGMPTVSSVTEDTNVVNGNLTATGTISITDADQGQSSFKTSVVSAHGNLGTLALQSDGSYTYTVANSAVQYLGANDTKVDNFTVTSADGTIKTVSFTIHGAIAPPTLNASFIDTGVVGDHITSATSAVLSGTAAKYAQVQIYDGTTLLAAATADNHGAWTANVANLADGAHSFTASQIDVAGNASGHSAASTMTVDTVAPAETISTIIGTDTGATATIASGGLTKDNTLALSGTVSDTNGVSSVRVYDGAALLGTATVSGGHWNFTTGALGDGTHSFTARATDSAGNTTTTVAVSATIDTSVAAPTLIATFLDSGIGHTDGITNATKATLSGTAEHGAAVVVYDGTAPLATVTADPVTGAWSYVATGLTNGVHSFTAVATDIAGNLSARSAASNMTVDTIAPAAPVLVAAFLDSGLIGDHITNANAAILSGTAEHGSTVVVYDGTAPLATVTADPVLGLWSYAATGLSDGTHKFTATATDVAGNVSVLSTASPMTVDTVASAAGVALFADTGAAGDNITSNGALKGSAEAGATVKVYEGATLLGTTTADSSGNWTLTPASLADGAHNLTVTATDIAGNSAQTAFSFTLDTTTAAPAVSLVTDTGVAGDNITSNDALTGSAEAGATVKAYEGSNLLGTTVADSSGTWTLTPAGLTGGVHNLSVTVTDIAGNSAQSAFSFTLDTTTTAPTVALLHDTSAGADNLDHITRIDVLAGNAESGAAVTVSEGANTLGTVTADGSGNWTFTPASLSDGTHTLAVTATDVAGNISSPTSLVFTLDTHIATPVIADATNDAGTTFAYGTAEAGSVVMVLDASNSAPLGTTTADSSGAWSLSFTSSPSTISVTAVDVAGNLSDPSIAMVTAAVTPFEQPTMAALSPATYADTPAVDSFTATTGQLSVTDINYGAILTYGITGGAASTALPGYNLAEAGAYGTLYLNTGADPAANAITTPGAYTYVPNDAAINALPSGTTPGDVFNLTVSDSVGGTASTPLTINVTGANDTPPTLTASLQAAGFADTATADVFTAVNGQLNGHSVDTGATLRYGVSGATASNALPGYDLADTGAYGTVYVNSASGAYTYVPDNAAINALAPGNNPTDVFALTVTDISGGVASTPLTISLTGANDTPTLEATLTSASYVDTVAADNFNPVAGHLTGHDVDSATLSYGISGGVGAASTAHAGYDVAQAGAYGTVYLNSANGAYLFVPDNAAINALLPGAVPFSDNFTLSVADGSGGAATQALTISIIGANDASVISGVVPFNYTVGQPAALVAPNLSLSDADSHDATSATIAVSAGFSAGNDVLSVTSALPTGMTATYGNNGVLTITGSATLATYQSILDSVDFQTTIAGGRTISFTVFDGAVHSATASTSSLSLDDISTTGIRLPGVSGGNAAGFSVSGAGDFNHDGYADFIIGAPFSSASGDLAGSSYVVYGAPSGLGPVLPLATLDGSNGFAISGADNLDRTGFAVGGSGDVNGDGFSDIIIGAPYANNNGHPYDRSQFAGGAYVVFGHAADNVADMNLSTLDGANGFQIVGAHPGGWVGYSVSGAGDVNGDGFADIIVGAPRINSYYNGQTGGAYVVFGHATSTPFYTIDPGTGLSDGNGVMNLAHLAPAQGFAITGAAEGDWTGAKVAAAGDVNGDGIGDLIIGNATPTGYSASATGYVLFGHAGAFGTPDPVTGVNTVDLSALSAADGFRLINAGTGPQSTGYGRQHYSVHAAGDVNGDGFGDIIIGAPYAYTNNGQTGAAYVVFGHAGAFGTPDPVSGVNTLDLATLSPSQGFQVIGAAYGDRAGYSVNAAGDVNGDGYGDIIVGAPSAQDNGGNPAGTSYVIFGTASGFGTYDAATHMNLVNLATLGGNEGFSISAVGPGNDSGYAVSAAGDVNGDGFADVLVASSSATPAPDGTTPVGGESSGESYIIFGSKFISTSETYLGFGGPGDSITLQGTQANESFIAGGQQNTTMIGGGGVDSFSGGAGNDTIHIGLAGNSSSDFLKIDGGGGTDTLVLDGNNMTLDLTDATVANRVRNIEHIDLGSGGNTLALNLQDVLNVSGNNHQLFVTGTSADSVTSAGQGWVDTHATLTYAGVAYASYTQGIANLLIDTTHLGHFTLS